jgi:hypothetical protein
MRLGGWRRAFGLAIAPHSDPCELTDRLICHAAGIPLPLTTLPTGDLDVQEDSLASTFLKTWSFQKGVHS